MLCRQAFGAFKSFSGSPQPCGVVSWLVLQSASVTLPAKLQAGKQLARGIKLRKLFPEEKVRGEKWEQGGKAPETQIGTLSRVNWHIYASRRLLRPSSRVLLRSAAQDEFDLISAFEAR